MYIRIVMYFITNAAPPSPPFQAKWEEDKRHLHSQLEEERNRVAEKEGRIASLQVAP